MSGRDRNSARIFGLRGETVGAAFLQLKLYRILARSYRIREGEIDIIAARGDTIAFHGPVLPHPQTARQLIQRALQGALGEVTDAALAGFPARLRALR